LNNGFRFKRMRFLSVSLRYALLSLARNPRRTSLSIIGVAVGVTIGLLGIAWVRGEGELIVRAAAESGAGHLRVVPDSWRNDDNAVVPAWEPLLHRVATTPGVALAVPRAHAAALLALGTRTVDVELAGVDPDLERAATRYLDQVAVGHYLRAGHASEIVVGRLVARRLGAHVGDELVVTVVDDQGAIRNSVAELVGIVDTGFATIDGYRADVALPTHTTFTGRAGVNEITIMLADPEHSAEVERELRAHLPAGASMISWEQVSPYLSAGQSLVNLFAELTIGVILLVVLLGVTSAQLTAVLQRRRELAILTAIGAPAPRIVRVMLNEGLALGLAGGLLAIAWATPLVGFLSRHGVDLSPLGSAAGFAVGTTILEPVLYPQYGLWLIPYGLALALLATVLASLYPALVAVRTDPTAVMRLAQ
jgi:ABC-type lipoprotein release transport system permease subunit